MMIENLIAQYLHKAIKDIYNQEIPDNLAQIQKTRPEFEGDFTVVVFPLLRISKSNPQQTATAIGDYMKQNIDVVSDFNIIKGFLNLSISDDYWKEFFKANYGNANFGKKEIADSNPVVIEYSSPNTNKPLHLGHVRNNLVGWSVAEILKNNGTNVKKVNLINDRGIHICKSMLAWKLWGNGSTPESENIKGDKLVGDYYVLFDKKNKEQIAELIEQGVDKDDAAKNTPLMKQAKSMLVDWENNEPEIRALWEKMNTWVYSGMNTTYNRMGVDFDKIYYESETYLLGKALVEDGLKKGILFKKDNGSVWCDLTDEGLDQKLLLRDDGTSVYMTQDLGTAQLRYDDFDPSQLVYVVGNEQNYHFDVLKIVLKKLGKEWADNIFHLSYGMVELPNGKMKSREGTVVDADDLMTEMYNSAKATSEELGKFDDISESEAHELYHMLSIGALKYFILKVDPKKTMTFNPAESIDFNGNTGPFIQYTHARIKSILRKANENGFAIESSLDNLPEVDPKEKSLLKLLYEYPTITDHAANTLSPAMIANFAYDLAKDYNQFYHDLSILKEEDVQKRKFRIALSTMVANTIKSALGLLGISVPERM